ncbi:MAG TPA: rhodanese-like domain-containing protein [Methylomirabilota bacterium]|nr:rhodanese-like domain-containing protein [Methylomirabilota bacterium]
MTVGVAMLAHRRGPRRRARTPAVAAALAAAGIVLVGAAPAAPPDAPVGFISVDELKARLDQGVRADIIDVRTWPAYVEMHIKGARSIPLRSVESRAREIPRTGLVVLY